MTEFEKGQVIEDLIREITALWQTDEIRRRKPTPIDEAKGGLHIIEQSLVSLDGQSSGVCDRATHPHP